MNRRGVFAGDQGDEENSGSKTRGDVGKAGTWRQGESKPQEPVPGVCASD